MAKGKAKGKAKVVKRPAGKKDTNKSRGQGTSEGSTKTGKGKAAKAAKDTNKSRGQGTSEGSTKKGKGKGSDTGPL